MKNIFLIVFICFLALEVNAQTEYDGSELGTKSLRLEQVLMEGPWVLELNMQQF